VSRTRRGVRSVIHASGADPGFRQRRQSQRRTGSHRKKKTAARAINEPSITTSMKDSVQLIGYAGSVINSVSCGISSTS